MDTIFYQRVAFKNPNEREKEPEDPIDKLKQECHDIITNLHKDFDSEGFWEKLGIIRIYQEVEILFQTKKDLPSTERVKFDYINGVYFENYPPLTEAFVGFLYKKMGKKEIERYKKVLEKMKTEINKRTAMKRFFIKKLSEEASSKIKTY